MKLRLTGLVTVCTLALTFGLFPATALAAPTANEVFDKYVEATGGKEAYAAIKNRLQKGTFNIVDMGMVASTETYIAPPNSLTVVTIEGMGEVRNGISDGVAWSMNPFQGDQVLEGSQKAGARRQSDLAELINWKKHYKSAEVTGEGDVDGEKTWTVEMTPHEGDVVTSQFSQESGLLLQSETTDEMGSPSTITFSDYKTIDGVTLAHRMDISGMMSVEITWDSIEHNVEIPSETFALPDSIKALTDN